MKKIIILIFFFLNIFNYSYGTIKIKIINNFKSINNISFDFKQNINDKIQLDSYKQFHKYISKDGISPITKYYGGQFISQIYNSCNDKISNTYDLFTNLDLEIPMNIKKLLHVAKDPGVDLGVGSRFKGKSGFIGSFDQKDH